MAYTKKNVRCISTRKETERNDSSKRDTENVGLKDEDILNKTKWKNDIQNHFR